MRLEYLVQHGELSSSIRGFFIRGDDTWIKDQIEDNHNLIPELKNQITNLEEERNDLQGRLNDTENKNHNLSDRVAQFEPEKEFADRVRKELKEDNDENCLNHLIKNRDLINTIGSLFSKV